MKIKLNRYYGSGKPGDIFDAAVTKDKTRAIIYDDDNLNLFLSEGEFEILPADYATFTHEETVSLPTILDVIGGDVKKLQLDVEFK